MNRNPWLEWTLQNQFVTSESGDSEAGTLQTVMDYNGTSPAIWDAHGYDDLTQRPLYFPYVGEAGMMTFSPANGIMLHVPEVHKGNEIGWDSCGGRQRGSIQMRETNIFAGVKGSGLKVRRAVVGKTSREESLLAAIDDDGQGEFESWGSTYFENPRPAPAPPSTRALPPAPRPHRWTTSDLFTRPSAQAPHLRRFSMEGLSAGDTRSQRSSALASFVAVCQTPDAQLPSPWSPQHSPTAGVVAPLLADSPPATVPKQMLGGGTIPLPTVSATCHLVPEQTSRWHNHSRQDSADSSMDHVYVQIQDCIAATEALSRTMLACSYLNHDSLETICAALKGALRSMQKTIDQGIQNVELDTPEKVAWNDKQQALESSVQKNVRKYYQAAIQTARKPPRINHLDDRMSKLNAYVRKFRDLNMRILVSYDRLRILELRSQLMLAYASVGRTKARKSDAHERERNERCRTGNRGIEELKQDIQAIRVQRSGRLMTLKGIKDTVLSPVKIIL